MPTKIFPSCFSSIKSPSWYIIFPRYSGFSSNSQFSSTCIRVSEHDPQKGPSCSLSPSHAYRIQPSSIAWSIESISIPHIAHFILLAKLDSVRRTQERGSSVFSQPKVLFHKFMEQLEKIFKKLPKPLEWRSFYSNDFPLLMDFCEEIQEVSIQPQLSQKCSIGIRPGM